MADHQENRGIVKKLLFPSFADAGSSDTFHRQSPLNDADSISEASTALHDNRSRHTFQHVPSRSHSQSSSQPIRPFFASTRPAPPGTRASSSIATPQSPPKLPRKPFPTQRNLSTVTMARGESLSSSGSDVLLAGENLWDGIDEGDLKEENMGDGEEEREDNQEGVDERRNAQEESPEFLTTNEENLKLFSQLPDHSALWEEEATPTQTAFGKKLLFARVDRDPNSSEVLSTASDSGTIVGADRMAELDDMEAAAAQIIQSNSPVEQSPTSHLTYSGSVWDKDLVLPVLDGDGSSDPHEEESENEEKKVVDNEYRYDDRPKPKGSSPGAKGASSMLSMAIRRIGSGLTGGNRGSLSAPNTPRAQDSSYQAPQSPSSYQPQSPRRTEEDANHTAPPSFLLRSPGSVAFQLANSFSDKRKLLSPRFSSKYRDFHKSSVLSSKIDEDKEDTAELKKEPKANTALKIARSCFSFDAYDTSMDEIFEVSMSNTDADLNGLGLPVDDSDRISWLPETRSNKDQMRGSASWDNGRSSQASAFRKSPFRGQKTVKLEHSSPHSFQSPQRRSNRVRMTSDFSPTPRSDAMELKTSQRIEIEREDALDILSCLVERGVSLKRQQDEELNSFTASIDKEVKEDDSTTKRSPLLASVVKELKALSRLDEDCKNDDIPHQQRMLALEELMRSHEYALEMRRASQSALSWLKSIDRSNGSIEVASATLQDTSAAVSEDQQASEDIDLLTAKAMLHTAQMEAKEKTDLADRLNEELAKCRAEIGRLRSASQAAPFKSPNRSIMDESDDISVEEEADRSFESSTSPIVGVNDSGFFDSSYLNTSKNIPAEAGVATYRAALEQANERIRKLHSELSKADGGGEDDAPVVGIPANESPGNKDQRTVNVRMLDGENFVTDWTDLSPPLPPPPDHGLRAPIVAAVLEQWSTDGSLHESLLDWMDQVLSGRGSDSIPPLTLSNVDHQVRDGFIMHVLPLLLRRADIRVDVKTRAHRITTYDLSVSVEPAAKGRPYALDIRRHLESMSAQSDIGGNGSTTHSTATEFITNGSFRKAARTPGGATTSFPEDAGTAYEPSSRVSYDEIAENGIGLEHPPGLMSALGGALGGLLTRRKPPGHAVLHESGGASHLDLESPAAAALTAAAAEAHFESQDDNGGGRGSGEDEPYHRVVSAPSGRIGVTFVEYRGHAMVSDVANDSPLVGWIFPSDILIAIDELPVSGMRVRDIIKVLKDRSSRQRALRVISSQSMNEFSLNTSGMDCPS
jgi:hypothetical protein